MDATRPVALLVICLLASPLLVAGGLAEEEPGASILFADQKTSGHIVLVDLVQLPASGIVAVHESSPEAGDGLGEIQGTSVLLGPGMHHSVPVSLAENVTEPVTLVAVLYEDANGNRELDRGHEDHDHEHDEDAGGDGETDPPFRDESTTVGDVAEVEPYGYERPAASSVDPLAIGSITATVALLVWAVRYR